MALKNQGLVDVRVTDEDRRKRAVTFTPSAEKLFSALG
jgi:DNA-binding MarR family transcriptional regulator